MRLVMGWRCWWGTKKEEKKHKYGQQQGGRKALPTPPPSTCSPRALYPLRWFRTPRGIAPKAAAAAPLAVRAEQASPSKNVFVCFLFGEQQLQHLRQGWPHRNAAGRPWTARDRANFICHPGLLLTPLGGLIILKAKVKVIHAYFFFFFS